MHFHNLGDLVVLIEELKAFTKRDNLQANEGFKFQIDVHFKDGKQNTAYFKTKEDRDSAYDKLAKRLSAA